MTEPTAGVVDGRDDERVAVDLGVLNEADAVELQIALARHELKLRDAHAPAARLQRVEGLFLGLSLAIADARIAASRAAAER